jgi:hypothetical protein
LTIDIRTRCTPTNRHNITRMRSAPTNEMLSQTPTINNDIEARISSLRNDVDFVHALSSQ